MSFEIHHSDFSHHQECVYARLSGYTGDTCSVSRYFYCYGIPRYTVTLGISQHYTFRLS